MLGKLDREAVKGALVQSAQEAFDDDFRQERREADAHQDRRIEIALRIEPVHGLRELRAIAGNDGAVQTLEQGAGLRAEIVQPGGGSLVHDCVRSVTVPSNFLTIMSVVM